MIEPKRQSDLFLLNPSTKTKFDLFFAEAKANWLDVYPFETLRTMERQKYLYGQWRPEYPIYGRPGKNITWTLQSKHLKWEAVDVVFDTDPSPIRYSPSWNWKYTKLIEIGKKYWLRNLAPAELCHFEDNWQPLNINNIIMAFYKDLREKEVGNIPQEQRVFKDPKAAFEKIDKLTEKEKTEELLYLMWILLQRLK